MVRPREVLRVLVLSVIATGETHGYEIRSRIAQLTGGHVKLSPGMLYPLLLILRREGLIEVSKEYEEGRKKKVYRLTPKGREYLVSRLATIVKTLRCIADFLEKVYETLEKRGDAEMVYKDILLHEKEMLIDLKRKIERRIETIDQLVGEGKASRT